MRRILHALCCLLVLFASWELSRGDEDAIDSSPRLDSISESPGKAPVPEMPPYIKELTYSEEGEGSLIRLVWELTRPCDAIVVCRGLEQLVLLPGDATEFTHEEEALGYFRYTVGLYHEGEWVDLESVLVEIGNIGWDVPEGDLSGYYLYIAEDTGVDPYELLPYNNPYLYTVDMLIYNRIWLVTLYNLGFIESGKRYHVAVSSYLHGCPETVISGLSEPITFDYEVAVEQPDP